MTPKLLALIEKAQQTRITPEELADTEIGFAYGNAYYENPRVTRQMVIDALPSSVDFYRRLLAE